MALLFDNSIGAEQLQLAIFTAIYNDINRHLATEMEKGKQLDEEFEALTRRGLVPATLEPYQPSNIHYGHRPSMVEAPASEYPGLSVMVYRAGPGTPNQTADYGHTFSLSVAIETIVKSGPYAYTDDHDPGPGEDLVGRRIKRAAEAIHALMRENAAIGGLFLPPEALPNVIWGDVFIRDDESSGVAQRYYWQGVRMEFTYLKQTIDGLND